MKDWLNTLSNTEIKTWVKSMSNLYLLLTDEEKQKLYNAIMDVIDEFERYWAYDTLRTIEEAEQFLEDAIETEEIPYILADTKVPYLKICRPEQNSK